MVCNSSCIRLFQIVHIQLLQGQAAVLQLEEELMTMSFDSHDPACFPVAVQRLKRRTSSCSRARPRSSNLNSSSGASAAPNCRSGCWCSHSRASSAWPPLFQGSGHAVRGSGFAGLGAIHIGLARVLSLERTFSVLPAIGAHAKRKETQKSGGNRQAPCRSSTNELLVLSKYVMHGWTNLAQAQRQLSGRRPAAAQADLKHGARNARRIGGHIHHVCRQREALHARPRHKRLRHVVLQLSMRLTRSEHWFK